MATPHRCPVCNGTGLVPPNFYGGYEFVSTWNGFMAPCRTCQNGVVWEPESKPTVTISVYPPDLLPDPNMEPVVPPESKTCK